MQQLNAFSPHGFTLFDLIITLGIAALLISLAAPPLSHYVGKQRAEDMSQDVAAQLRAARELALTSGKNTLVCGTQDGTTCSRDTINKIIVFIDEDGSNSLNNGEVHLLERPFNPQMGRLKLKASSNSHYLKFTPEGYANPYGSFHFCPSNSHNRQWIQRISVNRVGRPYIALPHASHGEVRADETGATPIPCP